MMIKPFKRVLVANRGEIAIRIYRTLTENGITAVGVFSKEDKYSLFRTKSDEAYPLDSAKGPVGAYLDIENIIRIAKERNVDAIHPGYGFLSENPAFVDACEQNGIAFIGPTSASMRKMSDKISSKQMAIACGVPVIRGVDHPLRGHEEALAIAEEIGWPVMLKASNGGGGRGMRIVHGKDEMQQAYYEAAEESRKAFGDELIFIEKYLKSPKHVEVQILGDQYGHIVHLLDRDCSVQRRHQKVVEYAPAFSLSEETRGKMCADAVRLAQAVAYSNVGTMEFLVDAEENYYFIEMNPRIQVEHTVTEMITGIDIVQSQILVAQGYALDSPEINIPSQDSVECHGYSIQARVTTEDPARGFLPDTGTINVYRSGSGFGIRLDGGSAFTGAEILPYYDSLLVKVISHDRSFRGSVQKLTRSLKEIRIRGVKTNIPFLINVLNNEKFLNGSSTTAFIDETPELFEFAAMQDRATKLLEFIGNKIVNERTGEKASYTRVKAPKPDESKKIVGMKDWLNELGPKGLADKILQDKRLYVTDTTMRDAHQSLFATRMRSIDMLAAAPYTNQAMANAFSVEAWGGATFDVAYRFLKESPWKRLEALSAAMPNTMVQMLLRASNAVGYKNYPDNVVREFIHASARAGVDVFRIFDSLNWLENMKLPIEEALQTGKMVEGAICYTGDMLSAEERKYTAEYYVQKALALQAEGVHIITIKDMAGLLKPRAAKALVEALKAELDIPVNLHTHDSTGNGVSSVLYAAEGGVDIVDLAVASMSGLTSQPCMNSVVEALKDTPRDTMLDADELNSLSRYYEGVRKLYRPFESEMNAPNTEIYKYEIPGGQYSNLLAQVKDFGSEADFDRIKVLYKEANDLLGNIVKVTPTSKVVGDLAIFMHSNGLHKGNILEAGKDLSYPDSVVDYFRGMIGRPDGGFPQELSAIVLKGEIPIEGRAGEMLPPFDMEETLAYLHENFGENRGFGVKSAMSYALYPAVYDDFCRHNAFYHDTSILPSHIYFYGLAKGEETTIKIAEGKYLIIKFVDMGEANAQGKRTLSFEVNGAMRKIEIVDKRQEEKVGKKLYAEKNNAEQIGAPIPGTVCKIFVKPGDEITPQTPLMTIEAMKMEATIVHSKACVIDRICVSEGERVDQNQLLAMFR